MTPEQEMRKAAISAAAAFCATRTVAPEEVIFAADVFARYIEEGSMAALQVVAMSVPQVGVSQEAELRERGTPAPPVAADPRPAPVLSAVPAQPPAPEAESAADVISLAARESAPARHNPARERIERQRKDRADNILAKAQVAKLPEYRQQLIRDAEEHGLADFEVRVNGEPRALGAYLRSL